MSEPTVIPAGGGELVGDSPDRRVEILCDDDRLHVTWSRFGPGREGADLHVHRGHTDLFFVLDGELTVRLGIDDQPVAVPAGTLARVPPMVVHGFRNASASDVRYLNLHAPGRGFAGFLRGLRDDAPVAYDQHPPPSDGGRPVSEAVVGRARTEGDVTVHADGAGLVIAEARLAPGTPVPERPASWLYVLDGEVVVGGARARAGAWVGLSQGTPVAAGATSARVLLLDAAPVGSE